MSQIIVQGTCTAPIDDANWIADFLLGLGAYSVSNTVVPDADVTTIEVLAPSHEWFELTGMEFVVTILCDNDWKYVAHETRGTVDVGNGFVVVSTLSLSDISADNVIFLDPRDAFGDGAHPTTQLCAGIISDLTCGTTIRSMMDIGCGSGILSIIAGKLGVKMIVGIDIDPISIQRSRENCSRNGITALMTTEDICHYVTDVKFDLVVANVLTVILERVVEKMAGWVNPGGYLVISGISDRWAVEIATMIEMFNAPIVHCKRDGWNAFKIGPM